MLLLSQYKGYTLCFDATIPTWDTQFIMLVLAILPMCGYTTPSWYVPLQNVSTTKYKALLKNLASTKNLKGSQIELLGNTNEKIGKKSSNCSKH